MGWHQGHQLEEAARAHHNATKKASPTPNWHLACFLAGPCHGHKKCPYSPDSRHLVWGCTRATNWCAFAASSNWWLWCHPKKGVLNQVNKNNLLRGHGKGQPRSKPKANLALGLLFCCVVVCSCCFIQLVALVQPQKRCPESGE